MHGVQRFKVPRLSSARGSRAAIVAATAAGGALPARRAPSGKRGCRQPRMHHGTAATKLHLGNTLDVIGMLGEPTRERSSPGSGGSWLLPGTAT
jgi:hypothetical protein